MFYHILESLSLFLSFGTIFWDDIMIICWWKLSKQTSYWSKTGFFFSVKKVNNIFIPNCCDIIPKWCKKILYKKRWTSFNSLNQQLFTFFFQINFKIKYTLKNNCRKRLEFFRNLFVQSQNWHFREEEKKGRNFKRDEGNNFCICNHQYQPQICIRKSVIRSQFCLLHFWKFDVFSIVTTDFCFVSSEEAGKIFDKIEGLSGKISSKKLQAQTSKDYHNGLRSILT